MGSLSAAFSGRGACPRTWQVSKVCYRQRFSSKPSRLIAQQPTLVPHTLRAQGDSNQLFGFEVCLGSSGETQYRYSILQVFVGLLGFFPPFPPSFPSFVLCSFFFPLFFFFWLFSFFLSLSFFS